MNWFNVSPPSFARKLIDRCVTFQTMENKKNKKKILSFLCSLNLLFVCLCVCLSLALVTGLTAAPLSVVR
jgi:hypothetical protein